MKSDCVDNVLHFFDKIAPDLAESQRMMGEDSKIHMDDFMDMLCSSNVVAASFAEWKRIRPHIEQIVRQHLCPNKDGYIWLE